MPVNGTTRIARDWQGMVNGAPAGLAVPPPSPSYAHPDSALVAALLDGQCRALYNSAGARIRLPTWYSPGHISIASVKRAWVCTEMFIKNDVR